MLHLLVVAADEKTALVEVHLLNSWPLRNLNIAGVAEWLDHVETVCLLLIPHPFRLHASFHLFHHPSLDG